MRVCVLPIPAQIAHHEQRIGEYLCLRRAALRRICASETRDQAMDALNEFNAHGRMLEAHRENVRQLRSLGDCEAQKCA